MESSVKSTSSEQKKALISTLVAAFVTDPVARWICPEAHRYFSRIDEFFDAFGGASFVHGSAYYVEGYRGSALWLPPKVHPNEEAMMAVIKDVVPDVRFENAFSVFEKIGTFHPQEPHWYLPLIGVDPSHQARGYGSMLMKHALQQCDHENTLATSNHPIHAT